MKFSSLFRTLVPAIVTVSLSFVVVVSGYSVVPPITTNCRRIGAGFHSPQRQHPTTELRSSQMESDFASAMPPKPDIPIEERMKTSAEEFITSMRSSLADGLDEPPELTNLEAALQDEADLPVLASRIYELMIERGMVYDVAPESGTLSLTQFDIPSNLEEEAVKKEFLHLYTYGMGLIQRGFLDVDQAKGIIQERLIKRTGLSPEEFDKWMGF